MAHWVRPELVAEVGLAVWAVVVLLVVVFAGKVDELGFDGLASDLAGPADSGEELGPADCAVVGVDAFQRRLRYVACCPAPGALVGRHREFALAISGKSAMATISGPVTSRATMCPLVGTCHPSVTNEVRQGAAVVTAPGPIGPERRGLVVPRTGGGLSAVLNELIRVLRYVGDFDRPERLEGIAELVRRWRKGLHERAILDSPIPKPLAAGVACRALMAVEAQLQSDAAPVRVQPLGREGRQLVPLIFASVHPRDLGHAAQGLDQLAIAAHGAGDRAVEQALESLASKPDDIERWGSMALRVVGLLGIGWNEDAELLSAKLENCLSTLGHPLGWSCRRSNSRRTRD